MSYSGYIRKPNISLPDDIINLPGPLIASVDITGKKCLIRRGMPVHFGDIIADGAVPVFSPISGSVLEITNEKITIELALTDSPIERSPVNDNIAALEPENIISFIQSHGLLLTGCCPDSEHLEDAAGKIKKMIICGFDDENCKGINSFLIRNRLSAVINGARILSKAMNCDMLVLLGDRYNRARRSLSRKITASSHILHPRFDVIRYPMSNADYLIKEMYNQTHTEQESIIDLGYAVFTAEACVEIYEALRFGYPSTTKLISVFNGNEMKIVRASIGSDAGFILRYCGFSTDNKTICRGSMINPQIIDVKYSVTGKDDLIFLLPRGKSSIRQECIGCGECTQICPAGISPNEIALGSCFGLIERAKADQCIECNLCSFVCPAGIDLMSGVQKVKNMKDSDNEQ